MVTQIIAGIVGFVVFLFIFWRRLKDDYVPNQIFTTALVVWVFIILGVFLSTLLLPQWWFWFAFISVMGGIIVSVRKYRTRLNEIADATFISLVPVYGSIFIVHYGFVKPLYSFVSFLLLVIVFVLYFVIDANYKKFTWYKSGKIGFASLAMLSVIFLLRGMFAFMIGDVLSFVIGYELYLSIFVIIISLSTILYLSRKV